MAGALAEWGTMLGRGVYKLPALGAGGSYILFAVTSTHALVPSQFAVIPPGGNVTRALERLEEELDEYDPVTDDVRRDLLHVVP